MNAWPAMALTALLGAFFYFVLWVVSGGSLLWMGVITAICAIYVTAEFIHSKRKGEETS